MVNLVIDGKAITVKEGTTVLEAASIAGINIPTLCYFKNLNEIGACRVCVVEIEGSERLSPACETIAEEGMVIHTESKRALEARKTNVELILSRHDFNCGQCIRKGSCKLESVAKSLGITESAYGKKIPADKWDIDSPLIRQESKCIKCFRCVNTCEKIQNIGVWELINTGSRTTVGVKNVAGINNSQCTYCGQCLTHCPVGAIHERDDIEKVIGAINDPEIITVAQIAPAVRAAWGENLGISREKATVKRLVSATRALGFDYVFDTDFSADLTIMEESSEFAANYKSGKTLFTSCCPGWVRFLKQEYPDMVKNLSTSKSPHQMFGAVAKTYFAKILGVEPKKIFCISIMPCLAKKYEAAVPELSGEYGRDVDAVITTRELNRMMISSKIDAENIGEEDFDKPLGLGTGAGIIFGVTGGVMEAALRSAHYLITGKNPDPDTFFSVHKTEFWKEYEAVIGDITVKAAVANGLGNARKLVEAIRSGKVKYDFVEVMACPGGCSGGGGQPITDGIELADERIKHLRSLDKNSEIRFSHDNPYIIELYKNFLGKPLSEKAHLLLHTDQSKWTIK